ncbi:MAG: zinc ribbon domain-containing protein [Lachnospiraceae bacterium]|nr:zinc ribbon domain-containing protein [Lachnospiraceae bacterium]
MIYCENCHAPVAEESAKCPYCGALNAVGGEKQYMEQLYDIKKDVEELSATPVREYRREIGKSGRVVRRTFLVTAALMAFVGLLLFLGRKLTDYEPTAEEIRAQMQWEKEIFPKLDALYAEGDYDGVMECVSENQDAPYYSISNWKHADFINVYTQYQFCTESLAQAASKGYSAEDAGDCIIDTLFLIQERTYDSYTEAEEALIAAYQEEVREQTCAVFGISEEEIDRLYAECCVEDAYGVYFDYQTAKRKVKDFVKEQIRTD